MKDHIAGSLLAGEEIRFRTRLHWGTYLDSAPLFIISIILLALSIPFIRADESSSPFFLILAVFVFILGVGYCGYLYLLIRISDYAITNKRFYMRHGIISRKTLEILHAKAESVSLRQSLLGRMLGYGEVIIGGTGGSKEHFTKIRNSVDFRRVALEEISRAQSVAAGLKQI